MTTTDRDGSYDVSDLGARLAAAVVTTSQMITDSYPDHLCREAVDRRRIDKLGEEFGEVVDAYGGWVGENPRKGQTNGLDKVLDELLDVSACALGAYEHLTGFQGVSVPALVEQVERKCERPGVCNAPGGHAYKAPASRTDEAPSDPSPRAKREGYQARPGNTAGPASSNADRKVGQTGFRCMLTVTELHRLDVAVAPLRRMGSLGIYLVGSVNEHPDFRDVDVRMIFRDEDFDVLFGHSSALWEAFSYAWSRTLSDDTGLRIDFQVQRMTEANERFDGVRHPLTGGARRFAGLGDATSFTVHDEVSA